MKIPLVDLQKQHEALKEELRGAFEAVLSSSAFINGPFLETFEKQYADLMALPFCVGVSSGTAALRLALEALGVEGREVLLPANTFVATAEAVIAAGARPVFVDVLEDDFQVDFDSLEQSVTEKTACFIPVHLFGLACDMERVEDFCRARRLPWVNDAAQAHLALYKGRSIATRGLATCWSFYPGKNLGALGDAGAVGSGDEDFLRRVRLLKDHGSAVKYRHECAGATDRMDGLQAAFLTVKLKYLETWTRQRQEKALLYDTILADLDLLLPRRFPERSHVYHLYVIRVKERDEVLKKLNEAGVGAGIHYPYALSQTPSMKAYTTRPCPVAEKLASEILSLPLSADLTQEQQIFVGETLKKILA
jgi:dTDP-4-amino-4,6-dideoxygalactose transaminase